MNRDYVPGTDYVLIQEGGLFKATSDSLILTSFVKSGDRLLDLGCGNGILSLRLINRWKEIYGVDINNKSLNLFRESLKVNNLEDRIKIFNEDILNLREIFGPKFFDAIVFNPPYFNSLDPKGSIERARHSGDLEKFIEIISYLIKDRGDVTIIFPTNRMAEIIYYFTETGLKIKDIIAIKPRDTKPARHFILRARREANFGNFYREFIVHKGLGLSEEMERTIKNEVLLWFIFVQHQLEI